MLEPAGRLPEGDLARGETDVHPRTEPTSYTLGSTDPKTPRADRLAQGSFTNIRGAHTLQYLVRTTERRPITAFLQSGSHDFDNSHGSWSLANQTLAQSLHYAGYRYKFVFGEGGHNMVHGGALLPQTLRWLWSAHESDEEIAVASSSVGYIGGHAFGWQPVQPYGGKLAKL